MIERYQSADFPRQSCDTYLILARHIDDEFKRLEQNHLLGEIYLYRELMLSWACSDHREIHSIRVAGARQLQFPTTRIDSAIPGRYRNDERYRLRITPLRFIKRGGGHRWWTRYANIDRDVKRTSLARRRVIDTCVEPPPLRPRFLVPSRGDRIGLPLSRCRGILATGPYLLHLRANNGIIVIVPIPSSKLCEVRHQRVVAQRVFRIGIARQRQHLQEWEVRAEVDRYIRFGQPHGGDQRTEPAVGLDDALEQLICTAARHI